DDGAVLALVVLLPGGRNPVEDGLAGVIEAELDGEVLVLGRPDVLLDVVTGGHRLVDDLGGDGPAVDALEKAAFDPVEVEEEVSGHVGPDVGGLGEGRGQGDE